MNITRTAAISTAVAALLAAPFAYADDAEEPEYPELSVTLGGTINDGNTEDESANLAVDYKNVRNAYEYTFGANGIITRTTTETKETDDDGTVKKHK